MADAKLLFNAQHEVHADQKSLSKPPFYKDLLCDFGKNISVQNGVKCDEYKSKHNACFHKHKRFCVKMGTKLPLQIFRVKRES